MVRGENIVSGTSTTGTGTLTLAACPSGVGAIDHDVFLKAKGFVSGDVIPIAYVVTEYTDNTFATPSKLEVGKGRVTLGAAIANATLTRDTIQVTQTGGAYNDQAPSAISIGTAANTLVSIDASAADLWANNPYFDNVSGDALGLSPLAINYASGTLGVLGTDGTGTDWYWKFYLQKPLSKIRATLRVITAYGGTTGTPASTVYGRIYYPNSSGKPGKLAVDLGSFGTNPLNATGYISTGLATGKTLLPGEYFFDLFATFTGASGTVTNPVLASQSCFLPTFFRFVGTQVLGQATAIATGGSSTASDPANTTGWAASAGVNVQVNPYLLLDID